jgi:hypothetical protein
MEWTAVDDSEEMFSEATATAAEKTTVVPPATVMERVETTDLESVLT